MNRKITLNGAAERISECSDYVKRTYEAKGYMSQILRFDESGKSGELVQIKNTGNGKSKWVKKIVGLENCATLKLVASGTDLNIEVMAGKWLDKAAVATLSWFVLWPLLITAAIGTFKQNALLHQVFVDTLGFFSNSCNNIPPIQHK